MKNLIYLIGGFLFGLILIYSEAFHWLRIQEMFYFKSFHMFGLLFSAIGTAALGLFLLKKMKVKTISGNSIELKKKPFELVPNLVGGLVFGAGWAITGACTAPLFLLLGFSWKAGVFGVIGALIGTFVFALLKSKKD